MNGLEKIQNIPNGFGNYNPFYRDHFKIKDIETIDKKASTNDLLLANEHLSLNLQNILTHYRKNNAVDLHWFPLTSQRIGIGFPIFDSLIPQVSEFSSIANILLDLTSGFNNLFDSINRVVTESPTQYTSLFYSDIHISNINIKLLKSIVLEPKKDKDIVKEFKGVITEIKENVVYAILKDDEDNEFDISFNEDEHKNIKLFIGLEFKYVISKEANSYMIDIVPEKQRVVELNDEEIERLKMIDPTI